MATPTDTKTVLSSVRATALDYLLLTYFTVNNVTEGPLYQKYRRRFNNIIFNNFAEISQILLRGVVHSKALGLLENDLVGVNYISVVYMNTGGRSPVVIQFFRRDRGVEWRVLAYTSSPSELPTVLIWFNLLGKVVGFCGDYCYRDHASLNNTSDYVSSLRVLSRNRVLDLPYSDNFVKRLFDILLDYLPEDVIKPVVRLGETVKGLSGNSQVAKDIVVKYNQWLRTKDHILSSDLVKFVTEHYDAINSYLLPFRCLPLCLGTFFNSVLHRFLLIFMREIYTRVGRIQFNDPNAVVYYYYLTRIQKLFKSYRDSTHIPKKAVIYLTSQIDTLVAANQVNPTDDIPKIDTLYNGISGIINATYMRAVHYLEPLINELKYLRVHTWILLMDPPNITFDGVHGSYHAIKNDPCTNCEALAEEVKLLNAVLTQLPLLEVESVVQKWILVLQKVEIPIINDTVEYLLSLPASCSVVDSLLCEEKEEIGMMVRMNLKGMEIDEGFFDGVVEQARQVVEREQVPMLFE